MKSLIYELLEYAVNIGLDEDKFWSMTIPEVNRAIQAWGWREKRKNTFICSALYKLPTLIAISIWDSKNYPEIYDAFPDYFDKEEIEEQRRKWKIQKDMDTFKAWAARINERQKERDQ